MDQTENKYGLKTPCLTSLVTVKGSQRKVSQLHGLISTPAQQEFNYAHRRNEFCKQQGVVSLSNALDARVPEGGKGGLTPFLASLEKFWKNPYWLPLEKILLKPMLRCI